MNQGGEDMQPPPTTQDVKLTIETAKHGNDPIVWEMSDGLKKGGPGDYPKVTVLAKAKADFTITINNPGTITFSNDPIWIQKDTKPTAHVIHGIKDISGAGTTVLKFSDGNANTETLFYVLNFANVPAGTPAKLDPIIDNQGGGPGGYMNYRDNSALLIGGLILLAALVLALIYVRRNAARSRPASVQPPAAVQPPADAQRPTDINES
jgi:hypothetical protein